MPPALQARLLRMLQERDMHPSAAGRAVRVDFDLICASNIDLAAAVNAGEFRADLKPQNDQQSISAWSALRHLFPTNLV